MYQDYSCGGYNVSGLWLGGLQCVRIIVVGGVTMCQDYSCGGLQCVRIIVVGGGVQCIRIIVVGGYNVSGL